MDRMPFGKHKGTPLNDLPVDYLKWLSTIELREPLASAVREITARAAVHLQMPLGVGGSETPGRSTSERPPGASVARSEGIPGGSQQPEAEKPKRKWLPRPEEDLKAYYSAGSDDGIPW